MQVTVELLSSICPSVCHGSTVAKRCKIGLRLLLITNRKSNTGFQMTCKSLTLDDLESCYVLLWLNGARYGVGYY